MEKIMISILLSLLVSTTSNLSLREYGEQEVRNPEILFEQVQIDPAEHYPQIQKLVFLTPWNKNGFRLTSKYSKKLDYVSPCWYSLQTKSNGQPVFQNIHNYDGQFTQEIRVQNKDLKLVPRIYVDGSQTAFFQSIGSNKQQFRKAVSLISQLIRSKSFDGIVWDSPFNFFEMSRQSLNTLIVDFIISLRKQLPMNKEILFNMGNPIEHMTSLDIQNYERLPIDCFLIQNYDKGGKFLQMIDKAIQWKQNLNNDAKLMLMLPFFSLSEKTNQALSTSQAISAIKQHGYASSRLSNGMRLFTTKNRQRYYIPSYLYFQQAFKRAEIAGASVGFWQGGNGLENYYKFM